METIMTDNRLNATIDDRSLLRARDEIDAKIDAEIAAETSDEWDGRCLRCNRVLTDPKSLDRRMGKICSAKARWQAEALENAAAINETL